MIADCNERQKPRREVTTAQALMKPNESKLIKDFVGALLSVSFYRDPCCTCASMQGLVHIPPPVAVLGSNLRGLLLISVTRQRRVAAGTDKLIA